MSTLSSPHDRAFKSALTNMKVAQEFFEQHLPEAVKQAIDFNTLNLCSESYIDEELQLLASDVVYAVRLKQQPAYLYVLTEHQRNPDKLMPFRILKYTLAIMDKHRKQHLDNTVLPLVIPLVFFHGKVPYSYSTDIKDLIAAPKALIETVLFQPFTLIDTYELSDEQLQLRYWAGIMQLIFKHIDDKDILDWLPHQLSLFQKVNQQGGADYLLGLIRYFFEVADTKKPNVVIDLLQTQLSSPLRETIMTLAERLKKEAFQKGIAEGEARGEARGEALVLQRLLQLKFGYLPADYQQKIAEAGADTLLVWNERVLTATTLAEVFNSTVV